MKKNIMMRLASGLLVAVLLTTCAISGTFAKYVTAGDANDSARVAKWGVKVEAGGSLFKDKYTTDADPTPNDVNNKAITLSVVSSADPTDKLVAPGTESTEGMKFGVTGKTEVAVKVEVVVNQNYKDIFLADGKYSDPTGLLTAPDIDESKEFTTTEYHPLKFTLTKTIGETITPVVSDVTLDKVVDELKKIGGNYAPNTDLATEIGSYTLTWKWAFENKTGDPATVDPITDAKDTTLGNMMADKMANADYVAPNGSSLNVALDLSIVVTQID